MSSVSTVQATLPHYEEALAFWDGLTLQCRRHVKAINAVVSQNNMPEDHGVSWKPGPLSFTMIRGQYPSTEIRLQLAFEHWGPKINVLVRGYQEEDLRYYPEENEFAVTCDQDDRTVALTSEGRSLTAHEFAKLIVQNFRRCFPGVSLPCPDSPLE